MHYKNGREAKNGDRVMFLDAYGGPIVGILYNAASGNNDCNGRLAACNPNDPMPDLKSCLHIDDVKDATRANPGELSRLYAALGVYQTKFGPF